MSCSGYAGQSVDEIVRASDFSWSRTLTTKDYLERYPNGYTCHFVRPPEAARQGKPRLGGSRMSGTVT